MSSVSFNIIQLLSEMFFRIFRIFRDYISILYLPGVIKMGHPVYRFRIKLFEYKIAYNISFKNVYIKNIEYYRD